MKTNLVRVSLGLSVLLGVSLTAGTGCSVEASPDPTAVATAELSSSAFSKEIASAEARLAKLRSAQTNQRTSALEFARAVQRRDREFEQHVLGRLLLSSQLTRNEKGPARDSTIDLLKKTRQAVLDARGPIASLEATDRKRRAAVEAQLVSLRAQAKAEADVKGGSGVFALSVLAADYTFGLSRRLPSLHTQVKSLRDLEQCRGDLVLEGMFDAYFDAALSENEAAVVAALARIQTQLSCASVRQLRALEAAMVAEIDTTLARTLGKSGALAATRLRQLVAIPLVLLADQNRALPDHGKPGLVWLAKNVEELARAAGTPGTVLHRFGLVVFDARANRLVPVSSKTHRAHANKKPTKGTKNLVFANGKGFDTNGLPAFVRGLLEPCQAVDLVAEGSGDVAEHFACDEGCGKAKGDRARLGVPGLPGRAGSKAADALCGGGGGGGGGAAPPGAPNDGAGTGGVTIGGTTSQTSCVIGALGQGTNVAAVAACAASQHPGGGRLGSLLGTAPRGGEFCRPGVSDEPEPSPYGEATGTIEAGGTTWDTFEGPDGDVTMVNQNDPDDVRSVSAEEMAANDQAVEQTAGADPPAAPPPPPPPPPPPAPGGSTPANGGGSLGQTIAAGVVGGAYVSALGESLESLEFMMQSDDPDEGQCSVNPQCLEPGAPQDCSPEQTNCSTGCTSRDAAVVAFNECLLDATGTGARNSHTPDKVKLIDDNLVNPTPDSSGFSTLDGGLLACLVGGTPAVSMCAGQAVRLCPEDAPNCGCSAPQGDLTGPLPNEACAAMQCASNVARGEHAEGAPRGPTGMCGCGSVMGGM
jgi:hypothetical protein